MGNNLSQYQFNNEQLGNARTIIGVGQGMKMSSRDEIVALQTALDESHLRTNPGSLGGSYGVFQQTPAAGWGSQSQVMDPKYAASQFYTHLNRIGNRDSQSLSAESQDVQRSGAGDPTSKWYQGGGYGANYARFSGEAQSLYNQLTGQHQNYASMVGKMPAMTAAGSKAPAPPATSTITESAPVAPRVASAPSTAQQQTPLSDGQFNVV